MHVPAPVMVRLRSPDKIGIQSNMPTTSNLGYITISLDFPADACACAGHGHDGVIFKDDAGGVATADASLV